MGWQLRTTADVRAWLTDLAARDPVTADQVGAAVLALLDQGPALGPPLAVPVSSALAGPARAAAAAGPTALANYDGDEFVAAFFAGRESVLVAAVEALAAVGQPVSLAQLRERAGLSVGDLAQRLGVPPGQVAASEDGEPSLRMLASYIEALGGRLDVSADLGTICVPLRQAHSADS